MFIVKAAIMYANGEIIEGRDYGHIDALSHKLSYTGDHIYGFITSSGEFVLPTEAAQIATAAGQVSGVNELTPEHLWQEGIVTG